MRRTAASFCLFLAVCLAPCAPLKAQFKERNHQIRGIVRLAGSLSTVAGARVVLSQRGFLRSESITDSNGVFVLGPINRGEYDLAVSLPGYVPADLRVRMHDADVTGLLVELKKDIPEAPSTTPTISAGTLALSDAARKEQEKGLEELAAGRYEESAACFRRVIALQPDFAGGYLGVGTALYFQQQYDEAEASLHRSLELDPNLTPAYVFLARLLNDRQRSKEVLSLLDPALDRFPARWELLYERGRARLAERKLTLAEQDLRRAHGLKDAGPEVHLLLANVLIEQQRGDDALAEMHHYLELYPRGEFSTQVRTTADRLKAELARRRTDP